MQLVLTSFPEIQDKEQDYAQKYSTGRTVWNTQSVISGLWAIADRELETIEP